MQLKNPALSVRNAVESFDEVYDTHFEYVHRIVSRLCGRRDVEDLVQEVFLVVYRKLPTFEGRANITTWLFAICHRVVGAHVRRERTRRLFLDILGRHERDRPPPVEPLQALEHREGEERMSKALAALSWKKRVVLLMFELEGWSCTEIAVALGIPVDTVYTRLHHARRAFVLSGSEGDKTCV